VKYLWPIRVYWYCILLSVTVTNGDRDTYDTGKLTPGMVAEADAEDAKKAGKKT